MFEVISYATRWTKKPGVPEAIPKPVGKKVIAKFSTLQEARSFVAGKPKHIIEFSNKAIKEFAA